ncbi:MAG: phosphodiesterase YaeI [Candidatus Methylacidiphilales bacterium]|nr:phosphodiesterase YaeI [Candidatus Methylacidiphilales bacterium]
MGAPPMALRVAPALSRRTFLRSLALGSVGAGTLAYSRWLESDWLELTRQQVAFFPTPPNRPFRLLLMSDFHFSSVVPLDLIARAIDLGLAEKPDLALLAGDFITGHLYQPDHYRAVLQRLSDEVACLCCLGNHDGNVHQTTQKPRTGRLRRFLSDCLLPLLHNDHLEWKHEEQAFEIIGLGDLWSGQCLPEKAFPTSDRGLPRLVLAHNPDSKSLLEKHRWNLMTCGHSHGGQCRLPLLGAPFAPIADKTYTSGLNPWRDRMIYTTRGVGNLHGLRFNCRPEVTILDLV